jgi:predicted metal-dependent hydrolase
MSGAVQQDLFGPESPHAGAHRAPPVLRLSNPSAVPYTSSVEGVGEVLFQRSWKARHYRLTLKKDGTAVATIPARGTEREALHFISQQREWLERARARQRQRPRVAQTWILGTHVLWRGELMELRKAAEAAPAESGLDSRPAVSLGSEVFRVLRLDADLRPTLEAHFARRAKIELPARTWELATITGMDVKQVSVRDQRSRWGSCSVGGTISLNWRLIQTPESVRDYIIYHELAHLKEMNHSERFWAQVERLCPAWREAEQWLKRNGSLLGL